MGTNSLNGVTVQAALGGGLFTGSGTITCVKNGKTFKGDLVLDDVTGLGFGVSLVLPNVSKDCLCLKADCDFDDGDKITIDCYSIAFLELLDVDWPLTCDANSGGERCTKTTLQPGVCFGLGKFKLSWVVKNTHEL